MNEFKTGRLYVQYGCGMSAPEGWVNFDASPTLRIQGIPFLGRWISRNRVQFPSNVRYGDILKGLPGIAANSCDGMYCSHVLEHLSLNDCRKAIANTYQMLKQGGIFRCVLPDLQVYIQEYQHRRSENDTSASLVFMEQSLLGFKERPAGLKALLIHFLGNSHHLWMWDQFALMEELRSAGFSSVRLCTYNDSSDQHFKLVEDASRFTAAFALEAIK